MRIVLVEDDYELRRMVAAVLRNDGYLVTEFSNGRQLSDYMLQKHTAASGYEEPDLIVSDVCMPEESGLSALQRLRAAAIETPVVLMTAFLDHCSPEQAEELGAVTVLEKPFDLDDLRMIVLNLTPHAPPRPPRN